LNKTKSNPPFTKQFTHYWTEHSEEEAKKVFRRGPLREKKAKQPGRKQRVRDRKNLKS